MGSRRPDRRIAWLAAGLIVIGVATAHPARRVTSTEAAGGSAGGGPTQPPQATRPAATPNSATRTDASQPTCAAVVAALPLRRRLAQLLVLGVDPTGPGAATRLVRGEQVGGIFIGGTATGLLSGHALARVRAASRLPLLVAVDEEGGRVQRIDRLGGSIPSAQTMAATMSLRQVRELALARGRQLRQLGVTVDFAPVVDIGAGSDDAVIGDRSFSADPLVSTRYAAAFAAGLRAAGVLPVVKHFPGHGHASGDSHAGRVTTPPIGVLRGDDLVPYRWLPSFGPVAVMVGHLDVPGLTGGQPASLSPAAYRLLRTEYRFGGVAITDDLGSMKAVTDRFGLADAVLRALRAGADIALWTSGAGPAAVLDRLQAAVASGELPAARVNEAVRRVLIAKSACA
ncbi:MAG TPA: glycoside hydrolase family 3 N-terminal domain-containing protein [Mycobacteriales bacterium]|nr:glycoside hydrolase family 3 N-terminal domain-containing protein [Mycobacteriales bacterium]